MAREDGGTRLQRTLVILQEFDRVAVGVEELAARFGCSESRIREDLVKASNCGVPDYGDTPGTLIDVLLDDEMDTVEVVSPGVFRQTPRLVGAEGIAVLTAAQTMKELWPDDPDLGSAITKLGEALDASGPVQVSVKMDAHLPNLLRAEAEHRRIQGCYWSMTSDTVRERYLEPLHIFHAIGVWYARCRDVDDAMVKLFRVDRFDSVELTDEVFDVGEVDGSTDTFVPADDATEVTIWFPDSASWVRRTLDVRVVAESHDGYEAQITAVGEPWLEALLLRTGGRVLDPPELRGLGADVARRTLGQYRQS